MRVLILLIGFYQGILACGSESSKKDSQTLGVELPSAPPHVAPYVTFAYTLVCGNERFTQNEVKESQLIFKDIKNISAETKCFLEVSGDPTKFKEVHKDATFIKTPTANSAMFYMSAESAIINNKISFSLYPLFKVAEAEAANVKVNAKIEPQKK
jgi:hypothetical protein